MYSRLLNKFCCWCISGFFRIFRCIFHCVVVVFQQMVSILPPPPGRVKGVFFFVIYCTLVGVFLSSFPAHLLGVYCRHFLHTCSGFIVVISCTLVRVLLSSFPAHLLGFYCRHFLHTCWGFYCRPFMHTYWGFYCLPFLHTCWGFIVFTSFTLVGVSLSSLIGHLVGVC